MNRVTIVVPTYNGRDLLDRTLPSVLAQGAEVVVVDDGSTDGTPEHVRERWPQVRLVALPQNEGVARVFNHGVRAAQTELVALVNNDVELAPGWADTLTAALDAHPEAAAATGKLLRYDARDTIDAAGDGLLWSGVNLNRGALEPDRGQWDAAGPAFAACAGAALYRRAAFDEVGFFDERFHAYLEDVDWSLRAQLAGRGAWYEPRAVGFHMGSATTSRRKGFYGRLQRRNQLLVIAKGFPAGAIARHLPLIVAHQLLWLAASARDGMLRDHLAAWGEAARMLPAMLRDRRRIQRARRVGTRELDALVRASLPADASRGERILFALAPEIARDRRRRA